MRAYPLKFLFKLMRTFVLFGLLQRRKCQNQLSTSQLLSLHISYYNLYYNRKTRLLFCIFLILMSSFILTHRYTAHIQQIQTRNTVNQLRMCFDTRVDRSFVVYSGNYYQLNLCHFLAFGISLTEKETKLEKSLKI